MGNKSDYAEFLAAAKKRREKAKKLKEQGLSYSQIGKHMAISRQRAYQIVTGQ